MMDAQNQYYHCFKGKQPLIHTDNVICQQNKLYIWKDHIFKGWQTVKLPFKLLPSSLNWADQRSSIHTKWKARAYLWVTINTLVETECLW